VRKEIRLAPRLELLGSSQPAGLPRGKNHGGCSHLANLMLTPGGVFRRAPEPGRGDI
jgi:hypothetical protein